MLQVDSRGVLVKVNKEPVDSLTIGSKNVNTGGGYGNSPSCRKEADLEGCKDFEVGECKNKQSLAGSRRIFGLLQGWDISRLDEARCYHRVSEQ